MVLPAHIAVWFARPLGLGLRTSPRPFFFEPVTHPFTKPKAFVSKRDEEGREQTKLSFKRLAEKLGPPFSDMVGEKKVKPEHLTQARIEESTRRWIDIQTEFTSAPGVEVVQKKLAEYEELAGGPVQQPAASEPPAPTWVSALSFPVNKCEDPYFDRMMASAEVVKASQGTSKTLVLLHVEGWSEGDIELFDDISSSLPSSIAVELWIDGRHDRQSLEDLTDYIEVIKRLARRDRKVVLYSSSILGATMKSLSVAGFVAGTGGANLGRRPMNLRLGAGTLGTTCRSLPRWSERNLAGSISRGIPSGAAKGWPVRRSWVRFLRRVKSLTGSSVTSTCRSPRLTSWKFAMRN